jgi:glycosyltransferase involved in cell wall biosynthesis
VKGNDVKKIALVVNTTWNIYNFRQNIIQKFIDLGYEVYVLAPIDEYIEYKENFPQITHINLRTLDRDSTNPIKDLLLIFELRRKYKKIKPDLIIHYTHKPNIFGTIAAKMSGFKSISVITGLGYSFINKGFINFITENLYKFSSRFNDLFIFENKDDRQLFIEKGLIDKNKAFSLKGCGVNLSHYKTKQINTNEYHEQTTFTFIGRLLKDKGIEEFAACAQYFKNKNNNIKFVVLGDFDLENPSTIDRDELLKWINSEIIDYKGFVDDVRPFIEESSCIVLPSYREGMPRIILEAMAMSKPVITTDTAGCRETVVNGKNGYLVEVKSKTDLIKAVEAFIGLNSSKRQKMGEEGRLLVETEFSDTIIASNFNDIISKIDF